MLVKTKQLQPSKPEPVLAQTGNKKLVPVRCTGAGELMVCPVNDHPQVGDGVNRRNKDGVLVLGDDGHCLRNMRVDPDGSLIVKHDQPIDVVPHLTEVVGTVNVDSPVTVNPVTVANMPEEIKVQEGLNIVQTPRETKVAPISFEWCGAVIIPHQCRVYSVYLTVCEPAFIEIVGVTGEMWTGEFKMDLFPLFIQVNRMEIKAREHVKVGGYVIYES